MAAKHQKLEFVINGHKIPVRIYRERRRNIRASIGKTAAILRMPKLMLAWQQEEKIQWFYNWLEQKFSENENLYAQFSQREYKDGQILKVGERQYLLRVLKEDRKHSKAQLDGKTIILRLSKESEVSELLEKIPNLISREVAKDCQSMIERRVDDFNDKYFQQNITGVYLKYLHSRWGSCSNTGNINLSTRLLFAPNDVIDYVIIHELAHLVEFKHSKRFWSIVQKIMPDYKEKEEWLAENGPRCRF